MYERLFFYIKRTVACSWHCQVLKRADFLHPFTPVTNPCYEGLVITKGNVQLLLYTAWSCVWTWNFQNVREVWEKLAATLSSLNTFHVFSFSFLLKKLLSALSDSYNSLSPQNMRLFFSRFLGEWRQASWGKTGKKQLLLNRRCCFAFFRRARSGRGGRDTLALRAAGFVLAWKTRTLSVCSAATIPLLNKACPCDRQCVS